MATKQDSRFALAALLGLFWLYYGTHLVFGCELDKLDPDEDLA